MSAKKATTKKVTAKEATMKKAATKKTTAKKTAAKKASTQIGAAKARRGDLIVIDSPAVGSPPREGEVLSITRGEMSVSYRVKWADGHETLISPAAGSVTILRA
jgi:hypothetical protein